MYNLSNCTHFRGNFHNILFNSNRKQINKFKQMEHIDSNFTVVLYMIFEICVALSNPFYFCYSGKQSTESYMQMGDCAYDIAWYNLPVELEKFIILLIANTQEPLYYRGLNVVTLDLETFSIVAYTFANCFQ